MFYSSDPVSWCVAHVYACVAVCALCSCLWMWKPEAGVRCFSQLLPTLVLIRDLLLNLGLHLGWIGWTGEPPAFASPVLWLQACSTVPTLPCDFGAGVQTEVPVLGWQALDWPSHHPIPLYYVLKRGFLSVLPTKCISYVPFKYLIFQHEFLQSKRVESISVSHFIKALFLFLSVFQF